jgi:hypothetical protein
VLKVIRVLGVREGVARADVLRSVESLPDGLIGEYDEEVQAVVVRGTRGAEQMTLVLRHFGRMRIPLVHGDPGSDEAILKYLPECRNEPAAWDVLGEDWAICTTCYGLATPPVSGRAELALAMQRHTERVHGGRQV